MEEFTAHNIRLPGGEETFPGAPPIADRPQAVALLRTLDIAFDGRVEGRSIVDLGCLEGGWTVEFARAGFDALGLEARRLNIEKCEYVADRLNLPNLRFVQDDVHNVERYGPFDAVYCSGLFYHLDDPSAYLRTLARCTRRILLLQTHFATTDELAAAQAMDGMTTVERHGLSPLTSHEGVVGRWYPEYPEGEDDESVERRLWASYGNHRSFWIEKRHLIQALRDAGFSPVYEQFDFVRNNVTDDYIEQLDRSLFVAYRSVDPLPRP